MDAWMPLMGTNFAVRFSVLNENQAQTNHGQTLSRLAERGGLDPLEAIALADCKRYDEKITVTEAIQKLAFKGK